MGVRVQVFDNRIYMMNAPGGDINRFARLMARLGVAYSKAACPVRTGHLWRSINNGRGPRGMSANQYGVYAHVYADADYAWFVHEGTGPYILPNTAPYLKWKGWGPWAAGGGKRVPHRPYPDGYWRAEYVRGQSANDFLWRGSVRGIRYAIGAGYLSPL